MASSTDDARRIKALTDEIASLHDEVRRLEVALETSRAFGTEQAAAVAGLRCDLERARRSRVRGLVRRLRRVTRHSARRTRLR